MQSIPKDVWGKLSVALATGFGVGFLPRMPGTFGTLVGFVFVWLFETFGLTPSQKLVAIAGLFGLGVPICERAASELNAKDPGQVVFDEIAAFPLLFLQVPMSASNAILGFVLFRVFDILKPWPVRRFEKLPGGFGVMIDDLVAACYGLAAMELWSWIGPGKWP